MNAVCPFKIVGESILCNSRMPIRAGSIGTMDLSSIDKSSEDARKLSIAFARPCMAWKNNQCPLLHERGTGSS